MANVTKLGRRLIAYIRVSYVGGRELESDKDQLDAVRAYCQRHGLRVTDVVVDLDESGADASRKKLLGVVDRITSGEADGIAVYNLSRMSRLKPVDRSRLFHDIEDVAGGLVVSAQEGHDWSTPHARAAREFFLVIYRLQWEEQAAGFDRQKQKAVMDKGVHVSGTVPFGYVRQDVKPRKLLADPATGPVVTHAFTMRAAGASMGDVARYLETAVPDKGWPMNRVSHLLKCRTYLGEARQGKYVNPGAHDALVTQDVFDVVQGMFRTFPNQRRGQGPTNMLAGVARCGTCGYTMERSVAKQKNAAGAVVEYPIYRCKGRSGKGMCPARTSVAAPQVEDHVWNVVLDRMDSWDIQTVDASPTVSDVQARIAAVRGKRAPFEDPDYVAMIGTPAAKRALMKLDAEEDALQVELGQAAGNHRNRPNVADLRARADRMTPAEKREVIADEVDTVTVLRVPRLTPIADRVVIHFVGEGPVPLRPTRGRPKHRNEVELRVVSA